jgi:hypothetical protein
MNLGQLRQAVIELGFDTELESEKAFYLAANRALLEVNDLAPKRAVFEYTNEHISNLINNGGKLFETVRKAYGQDYLVYAQNPLAYYFECNGNGTAYIEKLNMNVWEMVKTIPLVSEERKFIVYKGFIAEDTPDTQYRLRFSGIYIYKIRNIALYGELLGASAEDIPAYEPYKRIDLSIQPNFLGLTTDIFNENGDKYEIDKDYLVEDKKTILIPYYKDGTYKIWYEVRPEQISEEDLEDTAIDLDEDLAALLPELIASYIWLDGENLSKAQRYYDLYKVRAANILARRNKANTAFSYKTKGWA